MTEYKIYKMINDDMPGLVYYGSTTQKIKTRLRQHKNSKRCKSSKLFEIGEPKIIQLDVFDNELDMYKKEKEYIENNECLNVVLPSLKIKNYSKGQIYKIVNDDFPDLVYYGSTIQNIKYRFNKHKSVKDCSCKKLFETNNAKIELVEKYPCETKRELEIREKYYVSNFECINRFVPARTKEDIHQYHIKYNKEHKEQKKINNENYKKRNKKSINEYHKKYRENYKKEANQRSYKWRQKNPEKYKEVYRKGNEKRKEKAKEGKLICECGSTFIYHNKKRHERTIKHKNYLDNI